MSTTGDQPEIAIVPMEVGKLQDRELSLELLEFKPHVVHQVPTYHFRMVDTESGKEAGTINLRLGWDENLIQYAGHIGYGVNEAYQGRRFAARSVVLLKSLARRHGFPRIWITCDPENMASRRSCELAGAKFVEIVDLPETSQYYVRGMRQKCRYQLSLTD